MLHPGSYAHHTLRQIPKGRDTWPHLPLDAGLATGLLHLANEQVHGQLRLDYSHMIQLREEGRILSVGVFPLCPFLFDLM